MLGKVQAICVAILCTFASFLAVGLGHRAITDLGWWEGYFIAISCLALAVLILSILAGMAKDMWTNRFKD